MTDDELFEVLEAVKDDTSFVRFVELLAADRRSTDALPVTPDGFQGGWANQTIAGFLEAASAWATASSFGESPGSTPGNPWRAFATFLWAGRGYE